jgi:hypothetical protein
VIGTEHRSHDDSIERSPEDRESAGMRTTRIGTVLWPSFFSAGVATMVFFAIVDPIDLSETAWPHVRLSRELGYTIGFFMFWSCTVSSSWFTALLLRPLRKPRAAVVPR